MIDLAKPQKNEESLLQIAAKLDVKLLFVYDKSQPDSALIVDDNHIGAQNNSLLVLYEGNHAKALNKNVDIIFSFHKAVFKDAMHQRVSGLNHIMAKEMKSKDIMFGINVSEIINLKGTAKALTIGRIMQNIDVCRKAKVSICLFTLASLPYELRAEHDLIAFGEFLGMTSLEAQKAVNAVSERIERNKKKRAGKILGKGVEVV